MTFEPFTVTEVIETLAAKDNYYPVSGDDVTRGYYDAFAEGDARGTLWDNPADASLPDGTYLITREGRRQPHGYGFGYFVAVEELAMPVGSEWMNYAGDLIGVWHEPTTGKLYVDRVKWYPAHDDAVRHGLETHQLAIYDILNRECITLPVVGA